MNRKLLYIFLSYIALVLIGIGSCADCDVDGPTTFKTVDITGVAGFANSQNVRITDSIKFDEFGIELAFELEYFSQNWMTPSFNLIQSAYACDDPIPVSGERLDNIIISSSTSFNSDYPPGSSLTELFDVIVNPDDTIVERLKLTEYLATNPPGPERLIILLNEQPAETTAFSFKIEYYQTGIDEDFFSFTTSPVVLRR